MVYAERCGALLFVPARRRHRAIRLADLDRGHGRGLIARIAATIVWFRCGLAQRLGAPAPRSAENPQEQCERAEAGEDEGQHAAHRVGIDDGDHRHDVHPADCDEVHGRGFYPERRRECVAGDGGWNEAFAAFAAALQRAMTVGSAEAVQLTELQRECATRHAELWRTMLGRAPGEAVEPVAPPSRGDRRFSAPEWSESPVHDYLRQAYLINAEFVSAC